MMNKLKFTLSKIISSAYKGSRRNQINTNDQRILMYHSVGDVERDLFKDIYKIDKDLFKSHMEVVKNNFDKRVKDLEKTKLSEINLESVLNITFDDGYIDNLSTVAPIMNSLNLPFTVFVATSFLNKKYKNFMNKEDLKELSSFPNVSIGSHSVSHLNLTKLKKNEIKKELKDSKSHLEDIIGKEITMFSYPHGGVNSQVRDLVEDSGYKKAANSHFDTNKLVKDKFMLRRNEVWSIDSINTFKNKLEGNWDWLKFRNSFNH